MFRMFVKKIVSKMLVKLKIAMLVSMVRYLGVENKSCSRSSLLKPIELFNKLSAVRTFYDTATELNEHQSHYSFRSFVSDWIRKEKPPFGWHMDKR